MNKLLSSLKTKDYENEIRQRLSFINKLVKENNKEINDYYENIQDIEECNPLYYDNPTDEQITAFVNNIKVSHKTKIKIFIDMLSEKKYTNYVNGLPDSNNIFSARNKVYFKDYENIDELYTLQFWRNNKDEIINKILVERHKLLISDVKRDDKRLTDLDLALKAIDDYDFSNQQNVCKKIGVFINMLANSKYTSYKNGIFDENNIFSRNNKISFEGYEHIDGLNTSHFWSSNSNQIIETIYTLKKDLENNKNRTDEENKKLAKLNLALKAIEDYNFINKSYSKHRIEKFIEMLSNPKYTNYVDGTLDKNNIFGENKIPFEGYEHINGLNTSHFWSANSNQIIETIYILKKDLENNKNRTNEENEKLVKLNLALKAIEDYNFINKNDPKHRIKQFIYMLSNPKYTNYVDGKPDNNNIFSDRNKVNFEGYEHINGLNTSQFWHVNSNKIIETIYTLKKDLENNKNRTTEENEKLVKLNIALKAIEDYNFINQNNLLLKVKKFIEMLLNPKYTNYVGGKHDNNNIFSSKNVVSFAGYENIDGLNTSQFYNHYSKKYIIPMLFYNKMYDEKNKSYIKFDLDYSSPKYDNARTAVMEYLNYCRRRKQQPEFKSIDEYIDTLDKTKKEVKALIELRDSLISRKEQLLVENQELKEKLNTSVRRAM